MSWAWFALCNERPRNTLASAAVTGDDGLTAGYLAAWAPEEHHPAGAAKIDARAVDREGGPGWASLALAPDGLFLPFDDGAVTAALRQVLQLPPLPVFSTLLVGDDRLVGALAAAPERTGRLGFDPFANLFPARMLRVEAGFLGSMPAPAGPTTQRYGADNPWPWDRFSTGDRA